MKKISSILFILLFSVPIFAQSKVNTDSLIRAAEQYPKDDTVKVRMWIALSAALNEKYSYKEALVYSDKAWDIIVNIDAPELKADVLKEKAKGWNGKRKLNEALDFANKALKIYESLHRTQKIAVTYELLGTIYFRCSEEDEMAKKHYNTALSMGEQMGDIKLQILVLKNLAWLCGHASDYKQQIKHLEIVLALAQKSNNKIEEAFALGHIGETFGYLGNYTKAIDFVQKARRMNEIINERELAFNYATLADVSMSVADNANALKYNNLALGLAIKVHEKYLANYCYSNLAYLYSDMKRHEDAISTIEKYRQTSTDLGIDENMNSGWATLGDIYYRAGRRVEAYNFYQKGLAINRKLGHHLAIAYILNSIGKIYTEEPDAGLIKIGGNPAQRYVQIAAFATEALEISTQNNSRDQTARALELLSIAYEAQKDYTKAYDVYKKYIVLKDSIAGDEVKKQITRKEIQYEFDKKETALLYEQKLTTEQLAKQKALTEQQRQTLTLKEQALALQSQALLLANKEKDLQHLAFLKEKAEKQEKEQALLLVEKDKDLATAKVFALAKEKTLQIQEIARKNATIGFLGASLLAILLAATVFYLWLQRKQARKQAAQQAQFTQQLLENTEAERGRIARDLHDGISHELLGLRRELSQTNEKAGETNAKIDGIIEDVRQISRNLHPVMLDSIGLKLSLETLCEQFGEREALFVSYAIDYTTILDKNTELQLFRIVQEALTNTVKYANANASKVVIHETSGKLHLNITDNGKGFDVQKQLDSGKAFGLHSIIQRAKAIGATAKIESSNKGTEVTVVLG